MEQIKYEDFIKVEMRVGKIVEAINVEESDKLIRMMVDFGTEIGQKLVFSGIRHWYKPDELLNKTTIFVVNMLPKKIMGEESSAMILGAENENEDKLSILFLEKDMPLGTRVL
ncbi:MAG TPA: hypothetical protein VN174_01210 [Candidatus Methanoperedens sp.]|nr:hypothetical protein [Candidatus Methanoperedens sp.]